MTCLRAECCGVDGDFQSHFEPLYFQCRVLQFGLVGLGARQETWERGGALGLAAGVGAVVLPRPLGLGHQPGARFPVTPLLTVGWYLAGGLVAAAFARRWPADGGEDLLQ